MTCKYFEINNDW